MIEVLPGIEPRLLESWVKAGFAANTEMGFAWTEQGQALPEDVRAILCNLGRYDKKPSFWGRWKLMRYGFNRDGTAVEMYTLPQEDNW